jgi:hypothetical protein
LAPAGYDPLYGNAAQADAVFRNDIAKWGKMIDAIGLRID